MSDRDELRDLAFEQARKLMDLQTENATLREQVKWYEEALEKIARPIAYMQREAEKIGAQLDGDAVIRLFNDPGWLRGMAAGALAGLRPPQSGPDATPTPPTDAAQQVYVGTDTAGNMRVARADGGTAAETSTILSAGAAQQPPYAGWTDGDIELPCHTCGQRTIRAHLSGGYIVQQDPCTTCNPPTDAAACPACLGTDGQHQSVYVKAKGLPAEEHPCPATQPQQNVPIPAELLCRLHAALAQHESGIGRESDSSYLCLMELQEYAEALRPFVLRAQAMPSQQEPLSPLAQALQRRLNGQDTGMLAEWVTLLEGNEIDQHDAIEGAVAELLRHQEQRARQEVARVPQQEQQPLSPLAQAFAGLTTYDGTEATIQQALDNLNRMQSYPFRMVAQAIRELLRHQEQQTMARVVGVLDEFISEYQRQHNAHNGKNWPDVMARVAATGFIEVLKNLRQRLGGEG